MLNVSLASRSIIDNGFRPTKSFLILPQSDFNEGNPTILTGIGASLAPTSGLRLAIPGTFDTHYWLMPSPRFLGVSPTTASANHRRAK